MRNRIILMVAILACYLGARAQTPYIGAVAGTGVATTGYCTGCTAMTSSIGAAAGIATQGSGDLFFTDPLNHVVCVKDAAGNINVIAGIFGVAGDGLTGGPTTATGCLLGEPYAIFQSSYDYNIYFTDRGNNRVCKIDPGTGIISSVVGTGSPTISGSITTLTESTIGSTPATLNLPVGIAGDWRGNLYISDAGNHLIRHIDLAGSPTTITVIGGDITGTATPFTTGTSILATNASLGTIEGIACDDNTSSVIIAESSTNRILIIWGLHYGTFGWISSIGTGLSSPTSVACSEFKVFANSGNTIVLGDIFGTGPFTPYAGSGTSTTAVNCISALSDGMSSPSALCVDPNGRAELFFADAGNYYIRKIEAPSIEPTLYYCTGASGVYPTTATLVERGAGVGATVWYRPYGGSWTPMTTSGTASDGSVELPVTAAISYDVEIHDNGCPSTPISLGTSVMDAPHTGPTSANIIGGTDVSSGGSILYESTDGCNCGLNYGIDHFETNARYYWQKWNPSTGTWGYQDNLCHFPGFSSPGYFGAFSYSGTFLSGLGDVADGRAGTYSLLAQMNGCYMRMSGEVHIDEPGHTLTSLAPTFSASSTVICPGGSPVTITVANAKGGKKYELVDPAYNVIATITPSGTGYSSINFTGLTEGVYQVLEKNIVYGSGATAFYALRVACAGTSNSIEVFNRKLSINMIAPMTVSGDDAYTFCPGGASLVLDASVVTPYTGTVTYNWTWSGGATGSASIGTSNFTPPFTLTAGSTYVFTVSTTTSSSECPLTKTVTVIVPAAGTCTPCDYFNVNSVRVSEYGSSAAVSTGTCPDCSIIQSFHTIYSTAVTSLLAGTSTAPVNYYVAHPPTGTEVKLPTGTSSIANDIFYVASGINLAVGSLTDVSANLTIDHCHFFSSNSCKWNGIKVYIVNLGSGMGTNKLTVKGNSLIENTAMVTFANSGGTQFITAGIYTYCDNAGFSTSLATSYPLTSPLPSSYSGTSPTLNCLINCQDAVFNQNDIGISVNNYVLAASTAPNIFPFYTVNNVFTCRKLSKFPLTGSPSTPSGYYPFVWPDASVLATQTSTTSSSAPVDYNPDFGVDNYQVQSISATLQTAGIRYANVRVLHSSSDYNDPYINFGAEIGSLTAGGNLFDSMYHGILIINSNTSVYNNIFTSCFNAGIGISNNNTYSVKVSGGSSLTTGNKFYNMLVGGASAIYYTSGCYSFKCDYSTITCNASNPANYGINAGGSSYSDIDINHNSIYNIGFPISMTIGEPASGTPTSTLGNVNINNNDISDVGPGGLTSTTKNVKHAIYVGCRRTYITSYAESGTFSVSNNTCTNVYKGIYVGTGYGGSNGFHGYAVNINSNTIKLKNQTSPFGVFGISTRNNVGASCHIDYNSITGPAFNSPASPTIVTGAFVGILSDGLGQSSTNRASIACNYVGDINLGFYFVNTNHIDWKTNVMEKNMYGLYLAGPIDEQGSSSGCAPNDNYWALSATSSVPNWWTTTGVFQTFTNGVDPAASTTNSILNVRNLTGVDGYYPTVNGPVGSGTPYSATTTPASIIDLSASCGTGITSISSSFCAPVPGGSSWAGRSESGLTDSNTPTQSYTLFPNPTNGNITIAQSEVVDGIVKARVVNIVGASVYEGNLEFAGGQSQLNLPDVASGIYIVELKDASGHRFTTKLTVEK